jgi:hypothetical protein
MKREQPMISFLVLPSAVLRRRRGSWGISAGGRRRTCEGAVGLSVATGVEAVAAVSGGGDRDGARGAECGESVFVAV